MIFSKLGHSLSCSAHSIFQTIATSSFLSFHSRPFSFLFYYFRFCWYLCIFREEFQVAIAEFPHIWTNRSSIPTSLAGGSCGLRLCGFTCILSERELFFSPRSFCYRISISLLPTRDFRGKIFSIDAPKYKSKNLDAATRLNPRKPDRPGNPSVFFNLLHASKYFCKENICILPCL